MRSSAVLKFDDSRYPPSPKIARDLRRGRSMLSEIRIAVICAERSEGKPVRSIRAKGLSAAFRRVIARRQAITRAV